MKIGLKRTFIYVLVLGFFLSSIVFYISKTEGFSILSITSHLPHALTWDTSSPTFQELQLLDHAFSQNYSYLGRGGQCFAFISEDRQFVIKFFQTHFRPFGALITQHFPWISKEKRKQKFDRALFKLFRDFNSYSYASQELKEETGVIYVHLNKTTHLKKKLHVKDKLRLSHTIDLDRFEFVVQRRAILAFDYLHSLFQQHDYEKAKQSMRSLIALALKCCQKGFHHEDAHIGNNFGFINGCACIIDIGRFAKDPSRPNEKTLQKDYETVTNQLKNWVEKYYPSHLSSFEEVFHALSPIL